MATTTTLTTLKINYLSQAQYDAALANNQINANELYFTPSGNGVNTITTTAGAHTAITNSSGAVSFSIPTTAAHVGAISATGTNLSGGFIWGSSTTKIGLEATNTTDNVKYLLGATTSAPFLYNDNSGVQNPTIWTGYTTANKPSAADVTAGTFPEQVIAAATTAYTTANLKNIVLSTSAASSASSYPTGTVWIQYTN